MFLFGFHAPPGPIDSTCGTAFEFFLVFMAPLVPLIRNVEQHSSQRISLWWHAWIKAKTDVREHTRSPHSCWAARESLRSMPEKRMHGMPKPRTNLRLPVCART